MGLRGEENAMTTDLAVSYRAAERVARRRARNFYYSFVVLPPEKRRALCFLRLESEAQERQLMSSLGVPRFGNDVLVIVDLPRICVARRTDATAHAA